MAAEQQHGKTFENLVAHHSGLFKTAFHKEAGNAVHDIPAGRTHDGVPVSVKSAKADPTSKKGPTLHLADAVRFYTSTTTHPLRLIAGFYRQTETQLIFEQVHDILLTPAMNDALWGSLTRQDLTMLAGYIKTTQRQIFEEPDLITDLQQDAKVYKDEVAKKAGLISLHAKIDANTGRLQCSVDAFSLFLCVRQHSSSHDVYSSQKPFGQIALPFALKPGHRQSKKTS